MTKEITNTGSDIFQYFENVIGNSIINEIRRGKQPLGDSYNFRTDFKILVFP